MQQFLEVILKNYQYYHLNIFDLRDIGDALSLYLHNAYLDEFPDALYLSYTNDDRRSLAIFIFDECMAYPSCDILPEKVPFLIERLNVPEDEVIT